MHTVNPLDQTVIHCLHWARVCVGVRWCWCGLAQAHRLYSAHWHLASTWERNSWKIRHIMCCVSLYMQHTANGINHHFPLCAPKFVGSCPKHTHTLTHTNTGSHAYSPSCKSTLTEIMSFRYIYAISFTRFHSIRFVLFMWTVCRIAVRLFTFIFELSL